MRFSAPDIAEQGKVREAHHGASESDFGFGEISPASASVLETGRCGTGTPSLRHREACHFPLAPAIGPICRLERADCVRLNRRGLTMILSWSCSFSGGSSLEILEMEVSNTYKDYTIYNIITPPVRLHELRMVLKRGKGLI